MTAREAFLRGCIAMLPLSLAAAPWGVLAGSLALDANFTPLESQGLSLIVFAGAAQLVSIGMVKHGAGLLSILVTVALLTSQHLLYGLSMRPVIADLPPRWRFGLGFLMTDESFALTCNHQQTPFDRWYALGVGLTLYVLWNLFTLLGILLGQQMPEMNGLGLDFSVAATFIALIVPLVRNLPTVICVLTALLCSVLLTLAQVGSALVLAGLAGMLAGFVCLKVQEGLAP